MGLLGDVSDDDSDDDDGPAARPLPSSAAPKGKNQALLEAISRPSPTVSNNSTSPSSGNRQPDALSRQARQTPQTPRQHSDPSRDRQQQPQSQVRTEPNVSRPSVERARGRGDARRPPELTVPPAAATTAQLASSPPTPPQQIHQRQQLHATPPIAQAPSPAPPPRDVPARMATTSPMPAPRPQRPAPAFMIAPPGSPTPSYASTPPMPHSPMLPTTPLQLPPSTPITPLFAAPPPSVLEQEKKVSFGVMRGDNEDVLLERTREKKDGSDDSHMSMGSSRMGLRNKPRNDGDDFWRRFSMVAHLAESDSRHKRSSWLAKTEKNARSHSRWVAISGVFILCLIGAGIAAGVYLNRGKGNGHADPLAIGGKASESNISTSSSTSTAHSTKRTGYLHQTMTTSDGSVFPLPTPKSPARRREDGDVPQPVATPAPILDAMLENPQSPRQPLGVGHRHQQDRRQHRNRQLL